MVDAVMAIDTDGNIIPTADGSAFFSFWREVGTISTVKNDGIYKIQFHTAVNGADEVTCPPPLLHGN